MYWLRTRSKTSQKSLKSKPVSEGGGTASRFWTETLGRYFSHETFTRCLPAKYPPKPETIIKIMTINVCVDDLKFMFRSKRVCALLLQLPLFPNIFLVPQSQFWQPKGGLRQKLSFRKRKQNLLHQVLLPKQLLLQCQMLSRALLLKNDLREESFVHVLA